MVTQIDCLFQKLQQNDKSILSRKKLYTVIIAQGEYQLLDNEPGCIYKDTDLTIYECEQAISQLGYSRPLTTFGQLDAPKGCLLWDDDPIYNTLSGTNNHSSEIRSICLKGGRIYSMM